MAMAAAPRARPVRPRRRAAGESLFDHTIWCFASDGDLEEGISGEAARLAGHQQLGNLVLLYDDNHISIEGDTDVAFSEDVGARYEAYGWHVRSRRRRRRRRAGARRRRSSRRATRRDRPSLHRVAHDHRLAGAQRAEHRQGARLRPRRRRGRARPRRSSASTRTRLRRARTRCSRTPARSSTAAAPLHAEWQRAFDGVGASQPRPRRRARPASRTRRLPEGWDATLPDFAGEQGHRDPQGVAATCINAIAPALPELWGGSADLAESNNTTIEGAAVVPARGRQPRAGRPVRPDPALRHPRARDGRDHERHRAARRHPRRSAARSWSSATTCAAPSGSPR